MRTPDPVTEQRERQHADLDLRSTLELVTLMNEEDALVATAVRESASALAAGIDAIVERLTGGGRLLYVGAGTSGRLASMDAAECGPTFGLADGRVLAMPAVDGADEDDEAAGAAAVEAAGIGPADAVVALSASGSTPYTLGAARTATATGALIVAVVCARDSELGRLADHEVVAETGPEVIAGSTRLKAGTATKLVLNMLTTAAMIRIGKTYGNLMVDLRATNLKLKDRSERIVAEVCGVERAEARRLLEAGDKRVKLAIVMCKLGVDRREAEDALERAGGVIRRVVREEPPPVT